MIQRFAIVRIKRLKDFDGEKVFGVYLNDKKADIDDLLGIQFFPNSFEIGKEVELICIHDCHLKEH